MGMYIYEVTCAACDFTGKACEGISWYSYLLPDGETASVWVDCAWCSDCRTLVDAERVRSEADIERELNEFETDGPAKAAFLGDIREFRDPKRMLDFHLVTLRSLLKWRRLRMAPAHCLACGSTKIEYVTRDRVSTRLTMRHPGCGGDLQFVLHAHATRTQQVLYTVEGVAIGEK